MAFVVDASIVASWLMPDEHDPIAATMASRFADDSAVAPAIWWFEIRNIFLIAERRGRLTERETLQVLRHVTDLQVEHLEDLDEANVLRLAPKHRLTFYDAAYLEVALRRNIPLATLDRELISGARSEGVKLIGVDLP